jgi:hypothetical protein
MSDQRLVVRLLSAGGRSLRASNDQCRFQRFDIVWQRFKPVTHDPDGITKGRFEASFLPCLRTFLEPFPALWGRHVCCGLRQPIGSSR